MTDINRVILVGRLVKDAELKFTSASTPVARFSLAVNRSRKNGDQWEEEVSYIDIVLWGRSAEAISKYLQKGKQVVVEGELRQNRWEQDGKTNSKIEVVANNVQLLGGGNQAVPGSTPAPRNDSRMSQPSNMDFNNGPESFDDGDDIPF